MSQNYREIGEQGNPDFPRMNTNLQQPVGVCLVAELTEVQISEIVQEEDLDFQPSLTLTCNL